MSPEPLSPGESRAAEVLDRLVRDRPTGRRRSWQLRQLVGQPTRPDGSSLDYSTAGHDGTSTNDGTGRAGSTARSDGDGPGGRWHRPGWPPRVRWLTVVGAIVAVAVVASLLLARRPPPIDERLPMAASSDDADGAPDGTTTDASRTDAGRTDADGERADSGPAAGDVEGSDPSSGSATDGEPAEAMVHVAGAVASPGVVRLSTTARVVDAVAAAGGLRPDADPDRVNLAAPVTDGQRIVIPVLGQPLPAEVTPAPPGGAPSVGGDPAGGDPAGGGPAGGGGAGVAVVDLNTATAEQLDTLPGVGPATAAAILAHREESGPFGSVDELIDVRGIGEAKLEALRDLVVVSGGG